MLATKLEGNRCLDRERYVPLFGCQITNTVQTAREFAGMRAVQTDESCCHRCRQTNDGFVHTRAHVTRTLSLETFTTQIGYRHCSQQCNTTRHEIFCVYACACAYRLREHEEIRCSLRNSAANKLRKRTADHRLMCWVVTNTQFYTSFERCNRRAPMSRQRENIKPQEYS